MNLAIRLEIRQIQTSMGPVLVLDHKSTLVVVTEVPPLLVTIIEARVVSMSISLQRHQELI